MARKQSILLLSALFVFGAATQSDAQTLISSARRIDWTQAGITGGIPYRKTICATLSPGATFTQINSAIAACNNGVVFLNPGTYNLAGGIVFNNKATSLRAGPMNVSEFGRQFVRRTGRGSAINTTRCAGCGSATSGGRREYAGRGDPHAQR
jgi:hypothetical protein